MTTLIKITLSCMLVSGQKYKTYRYCDAGITYLKDNRTINEKIPGTVITLADYSHLLEIKSALVCKEFGGQDNFTQFNSPIFLDLQMVVSPKQMRQDLTSEKVFTGNALLRLNNVSRQVSVQYTCLPESTENDGQMLFSLIVTFNLLDFFPNEYSNGPVTFVINDGYVNRGY